ncbi:MAG: OPT/YSL family transporter [Defluviitaleaceae bacterium]|nr:OPT/YSL family transporter [Defluviitaleaceae bacterium]
MEQKEIETSKERVSLKEVGTLVLGIGLSILSAAICMQIMGNFGTAPNTSLIGAVLVMIVARIPLMATQKFRNTERQNNVLSMASSAGFVAANCGFIAIATVFIMGRSDLIMPSTIAALAGSMISIFIMGKLFDSKIFPARGGWPMGQAVATMLEAGDGGGKKAWQLVQGLVVGAVASFFGIPAAGMGVAFIANMFSMGALAIGMILNGYSALFFAGFEIRDSNIAQGMMMGAGVVALVQIILAIFKKNKKKDDEIDYSVGDGITKKVLAGGGGIFVLGALVIAFISGIFTDMNLGQSLLWLVFSGFSALLVMILVGTASMHSGWAPAFGVVATCLTLGIFMGFPPVSLAVLVGYIGAIGMPLADTGIGLKAGWLIRGKGENPDHEKRGRRQQVVLKQIGAVIGAGMAIIFGMILLQNNVTPPMSAFYAAAVETPADPAVLGQLALWAIPGALLQVVFGNKSVGLMIATGLLINNPLFGIMVLASIVLRLIIGTKFMTVRAPGLIAGDGLFGFGANIFNALF